jgi:hypothetical protein
MGQVVLVGVAILLTTKAWYCDIYKSRIHGCLGCWVQRFLFTIVVIAPTVYVLYDIHH